MKILLLGYYSPKYIKPLQTWAKNLKASGHIVKEMYPDEYYKEDVLTALKLDYELVIYFGHGIPSRWSGFGGISCEELAQIRNPNPNRILLGMSCYSINEAEGKGAAKVLAESSYAGIVAGYKDRIRYEDNLENLDKIMQLLINNGGLTKEELAQQRDVLIASPSD